MRMTTLNPSNFKVGAVRNKVMGNPAYKFGLSTPSMVNL